MFNGTFLRLALEAGLALALSSIYNVYIIMCVGFEKMETQLPFFWLNLVSLAVMLTVTAVSPIFFVAFYMCNKQKWEDEHFETKWGAVLEGLKKDKKSSLIYPVFFLIRRIIFVVSAVYLRHFLLFQICTQLFSLWFSINYLLEFRPFEDALTMNLELMNEFTCAILMYHVLVFNPAFVADDQPREVLGYSFILIVCLNVAVHVYFLCRTVYTEASQKIKELIFKCRQKKLASQSTKSLTSSSSPLSVGKEARGKNFES